MFFYSLNVFAGDFELPNGKSYKFEQFNVLFWYGSIIRQHRMRYYQCIDSFPETKENHSTAFKGKFIENFEKNLFVFIGEPYKEWLLRKGEDLSARNNIHSKTMSQCKEFASNTKEFVNMFENMSKKKGSKIVEISKELSGSSSNELKKIVNSYIEALKTKSK